MGIKSKLIENIGPYAVYPMTRFLTRNTPKVLMFHRFSEYPAYRKSSARVFEKQLQMLKNNFQVLALDDILSFKSQHGVYPKNAVALTFDDGYQDFYKIAYPLLKKYELPGTLYITSDFVDGKIWLWPDIIEYVLEKYEENYLDLKYNDFYQDFDLRTEADSQQAWHKIVQFCITQSNSTKLDFINYFLKVSGVQISKHPIDDYSAVNWEQVRENNSYDAPLIPPIRKRILY